MLPGRAGGHRLADWHKPTPSKLLWHLGALHAWSEYLGARMLKVRFAVFQVDFAKDAKNQIGILAVFQVDFAKDAKSPGGTPTQLMPWHGRHDKLHCACEFCARTRDVCPPHKKKKNV
jgi:hypothetical protein